MTLNSNPVSIVVLGASGAVGTAALNELLNRKNIERLTLLGRNQKTMELL